MRRAAYQIGKFIVTQLFIHSVCKSVFVMFTSPKVFKQDQTDLNVSCFPRKVLSHSSGGDVCALRQDKRFIAFVGELHLSPNTGKPGKPQRAESLLCLLSNTNHPDLEAFGLSIQNFLVREKE